MRDCKTSISRSLLLFEENLLLVTLKGVTWQWTHSGPFQRPATSPSSISRSSKSSLQLTGNHIVNLESITQLLPSKWLANKALHGACEASSCSRASAPTCVPFPSLRPPPPVAPRQHTPRFAHCLPLCCPLLELWQCGIILRNRRRLLERYSNKFGA